jgi:hypothetical protein
MNLHLHHLAHDSVRDGGIARDVHYGYLQVRACYSYSGQHHHHHYFHDHEHFHIVFP